MLGTTCKIFTPLYTGLIASFSRQETGGWTAYSIAELVSGKPKGKHLPLNPQPLIVMLHASATNGPATVGVSYPWCVTVLPVPTWALPQTEF